MQAPLGVPERCETSLPIAVAFTVSTQSYPFERFTDLIRGFSPSTLVLLANSGSVKSFSTNTCQCRNIWLSKIPKRTEARQDNVAPNVSRLLTECDGIRWQTGSSAFSLELEPLLERSSSGIF